MAITLAQPVVKGTTLAANACSGTLGSNTTTGNTLVVIANGYSNVTQCDGGVSVSISGGSGTFTELVSIVEPPDFSLASLGIWVAPNITGGTTPTITVTFSAALTNGSVFLMELAGMPSTLTTDGTAASNSGTGANPTTPNITTSGLNDIILVACAPSNTATGAASPFNTNFIADSGQTGNAFSYEIVSSAQTGLNAVFTQPTSAVYQTVIAALQGTSGGSVSPTLSGSVALTGIPHVTLQFETDLTGVSLITGSLKPGLGLAPLSGSIGVSGSVNPTIGTLAPLSGSITVSGSLKPSLGLAPLSGSIGVSGSVNQTIGTLAPLFGSISVSGSVAPIFSPLQILLSGSVGLSGSVAPIFSPLQILLSGSIGLSGIVSVTFSGSPVPPPPFTPGNPPFLPPSFPAGPPTAPVRESGPGNVPFAPYNGQNQTAFINVAKPAPPQELGPRPSDPALNTVGDRYSGPGYGPVGQGTIGVGNPVPVTPGPPPAQVRIYIQGNNLIIVDNDTGNTYAVPLAVGLSAQPAVYSPTK